MTPHTLEFLLRLTVVWAALLVFYYAALRSAPFRFQRYYLLGALVAGVVIPLLPAVGGGLPVAGLPAVTFVAEPFYVNGNVTPVTDSNYWSWTELLTYTYLFLTTLFLARTLVQWRELWQWWRGGRREVYNAHPVVRHPAIGGPFVAFGCIFLPASLPDDQLETTALLHETAHLRSRHHYDTLLLTLGGWLLWFHPLFWVLRRQLTTVHEYEADAAVIQRVPVRTYGLQLLQHSLGPAGYPGLFSSPLKLRIDMITNNTRVRSLGLLPLLLLCFLLAGLLVACSDMGEQVAVPLEQDNPFTEMAEDPFAHMDEPVVRNEIDDEFSEALDAGNAKLLAGVQQNKNELELIKAVYSKIVYPAVERNQGVVADFCLLTFVGKDGKISGVQDVGSDCTNEDAQTTELTIVGQGKQQRTATDATSFKKEARRVLESIQLEPPVNKNGDAAPFAHVLKFSFRLE